MAATNEMKIAFTAETDHLVMIARIIARYLTALADELIALNHPSAQFIDQYGRPVDGDGALISETARGENP